MAACGTAYMEHSVYPRRTQRAIMEANTMQETALLELRGICKFFPGVRALDGVDFTLRKGEIHALMGENGAGKSTLIKVLTGVYSKDEGTISMEGTPVQIRTTQDALKVGISTVYQEITLCPNLTVAENLYIGRTRGAFTNWRKMNAGAKKILESLGIPAAPTQQLSSCSIAVQQMVAIARAVDMECKVLILDEPTSSLDEQEVEKLFKLMLDLKSRGVGIIFVTHFLEQVYAVCDRITVLRDGKLVGEYKIADLPRVQLVSKMLGKELDDLSEIKSEGAADALDGAQVVYEAAGLSSAAGVRPFDFSIRKGEVNGFTGLLGSGRSESVRAIFGADHVSGGTVKMDGKPVKITSPLRAMKHGISYLPEDRKRDGIIGDLSVRDNIILPSHFQGKGRAVRRGIHQAPEHQDSLDRHAHQGALRRQPAEGHSGALAAGEPRLYDPRRADARHRRRHEGRNSEARFAACRRGQERDVHFVRDRRNAPRLLPPHRHARPAGRRRAARQRPQPEQHHENHCRR